MNETSKPEVLREEVGVDMAFVAASKRRACTSVLGLVLLLSACSQSNPDDGFGVPGDQSTSATTTLPSPSTTPSVANPPAPSTTSLAPSTTPPQVGNPPPPGSTSVTPPSVTPVTPPVTPVTPPVTPSVTVPTPVPDVPPAPPTAGGGETSSDAPTLGQTSDGEDSAPPDSGPLPIKPSAGCSAGGSGTPQVTNAIVGLPMGYDPSTPSPAIFAFHAAGNPSNQLQNEYGNTVLGKSYVMIYGAAAGGTGGWSLQADKTRFQTMFDEVLAKVCVDENRIFATGHSSGAQFVVQLLCDGETRFRGVAPVASSAYCNKWDQAVPALVIHGQMDQERAKVGDGDGAKDLAPFLASNGCRDTNAPATLDVAGCSGSIDPNCKQFDGCNEPTIWCQHNDPNYSNTQHGIPCFAESAMHDFFSGL